MFEFTNTLNGITHNALRRNGQVDVATMLTGDSYFTGYSLLTYLFLFNTANITIYSYRQKFF